MTQRVKILVPLSVKGKNQKPGDVIEVEDDQVDEYLTHGWAEKVADEPTASTPAADQA